VSTATQRESVPSAWHMILPLVGIGSAVLLAAALLTYGTKAPMEAAPLVEDEPYQIILPEGWTSQARHRPAKSEEDL
jgi:hypothetical protein